MIERYWTPELFSVWGEVGELNRLLDAAWACAYASGGQDLADAVQEVRPLVTLDDWRRYEQRFDHDIAGLVELIRDLLPEKHKSVWHSGRTSSDLVETALGIGVTNSMVYITQAKDALTGKLAELAVQYKHLPVVGRTHGQHAELTTVGRRFAVHCAAIANIGLIAYRVGKLSGPVGATPPEHEGEILKELGLLPTMNTQVVPRTWLASSVASLLPLTVGLSNLATMIRLGSQSGIAYLSEVSPAADARGSSSMPQKRNPIRSERAVGLCKVIRGDVLSVVEAGAELWDERDISHSSVERIALVDALALTHFVCKDLFGVLARLAVDPRAASQHTDEPTGASALRALVGSGMEHGAAYARIRSLGPVGAVRGLSDAFPDAYDPSSEQEYWDALAAKPETADVE